MESYRGTLHVFRAAEVQLQSERQLYPLVERRCLVPSTMGSTDPCLFHNPFAAHPYSGVLTHLPQVRLTESGPPYTRGSTAREILGLPMGWPNFTDDE
jgi:hypothetical protein